MIKSMSQLQSHNEREMLTNQFLQVSPVQAPAHLGPTTLSCREHMHPVVPLQHPCFDPKQECQTMPSTLTQKREPEEEREQEMERRPVSSATALRSSHPVLSLPPTSCEEYEMKPVTFCTHHSKSKSMMAEPRKGQG